jgi:hypothetical protein
MRGWILAGLLAGGIAVAEPPKTPRDHWAEAFASPPVESRPWCYWWWLNGAASKEGITRDFEEMRKKGISGALLFDAGQAGPDAPRGPAFMSADWRELYKHAVREADRLGIVLGVNLCSGWNVGGPWVTSEHAAKKIVSAQTVVRGPGRISLTLPMPSLVQGFYRDIAVLAAPEADGDLPEGRLVASSQFQQFGPNLASDGKDDSRWVSRNHKPERGPTLEHPEYLQFDFEEPRPAAAVWIQPHVACGPKEVEVQCSDDGRTFRTLLQAALPPREKSTLTFAETRARHFRILFRSAHPQADGSSWTVQVAEIALLTKSQAAHRWDHRKAVDLTAMVNADGQLVWDAPTGSWRILRCGYTLFGRNTKNVGSGSGGLEIDTMSAAAMDAHFAETGAKLIADAGSLAGKSLQYFHIDSWELGQPTWTPRMREEFRRRRGYDLIAWLPVLADRVVDDEAQTGRFVQDYRRTVADLVAANYYGRLRELTLQGGLRGTHPESGGPHFTHWIDALQCEGINDVPMGEYWKRNSEPDGIIWHHHNPSLKQAASAAHIYGKRVCQAEAYTSFGCDWNDDPWSMKDIGDAAFCEGLTRNVLCFWVHQSRLDAKPGFQWQHVGTHFDSNLTWWPMSDAWLTYLARCQYLLRQGMFVADLAYLQSETIPSFIAPRPDLKPPRPAGFDYDALNAEVLLARSAAKDGRLTLPDGISYRYLVLPHVPDAMLSPATLEKINRLASAGVAVVGPPAFAAAIPRMKQGSLDAIVRADGLAPDIQFSDASVGANFDWIHRREDDNDLYFVSNQTARDAAAQVVFRVTGKTPELWDAVTGQIRDLPEWREEAGRTTVPLQFAPRQSWFVVFRERGVNPDAGHPRSGRNFPALRKVMDVTGAWEAQFNPMWFYPDNGAGGRVRFEHLTDWTQRPEEAVRYYSGAATYRLKFDFRTRPAGQKTFLDLGVVRNIARIRLNGHDLGVVWTAPWRVEITGALKAGTNELEIEVANLWPNRLIGDATLPEGQRRTVTNVRTYDTLTGNTHLCGLCAERKRTGQPAVLLSSGLLGPVTIQGEE